MFRRAKVVWSPVEEEYLKAHPSEPLDQLCIALSKSKNAVTRKRAEQSGKAPVVTKVRKTISNIRRREDLNLFLRSGWEANVARWLKSKGIDWEYEPETFFYTKFKHGTVSYTPDFKVRGGLVRLSREGESLPSWRKTKSSYSWIEVKGFLKKSYETRFRRFKKYYPEEFKKLIVIVGSKNTKAAKFFADVGVPEKNIIGYNVLNKEGAKTVEFWE